MRPRSSRRSVAIALAALAAAGGGAVAVAQTASDGVIGPSLGILDNGRHLHPYGKLVGLGQFPTGGAVTPNGRYLWTVSTGRGQIGDLVIRDKSLGKVEGWRT